MLSERIRQARLMAGLTLDALADKVELTHTTIQKYEKGKLVPSSGQLLKIAAACGLRMEYFFRSNSVELSEGQFRAQKALGQKKREAVRLLVQAKAEKWCELINAFPKPPVSPFARGGQISQPVRSLDELEEVADRFRTKWKLGAVPVGSMKQFLETIGVIVVELDIDDKKFSGYEAVVTAPGGVRIPVVAVSKVWPADRQRFTLAHELGHLLLLGRLAPGVDEEKACDRFAGAFLTPKAAVVHCFGDSRRRLDLRELMELKKQFGVSVASWVMRCVQCGVIGESEYVRLQKLMSKLGWKKGEPSAGLQPERSLLFQQLVYRAISENYVSESKAAELLGIPLTELVLGSEGKHAPRG